MSIDTFFFFLVIFAVFGIGRWVGARRRSHPAAVPATVPGQPLGQQLMGLAEKINNNLAHPGDLRNDVAFQHGVERLSRDDVELGAVVEYAAGGNVALACMALEVLAGRPADAELFTKLLRTVGSTNWFQHAFLLPALATHTPSNRSLVAELLVASSRERWDDWWEQESGIYEDLESFVRNRLDAGERPRLVAETPSLTPEAEKRLLALIARLDLAKPLAQLKSDVVERRERVLDVDALREIGILHVGRDDELDPLIQQHPGFQDAVERSLAVVLGARRRSLLLVGSHGVGKTAVGSAVFAELRKKKWTVFEASATQIIAGQVYIGQVEQRVQLMLRQLRPERRILWFVPELAPLLWAGRHESNRVGVLDSVLPAIERGELIVVAEITAKELESLAQQQPRIQNAFEVIRLHPPGAKETVELARSWAGAVGKTQKESLIDDATIDEAWQLTQQYLTDRVAPGNLIGLLGATWQRLAGVDGRPAKIGVDDLIVTLANQTGLPTAVLDDRAGLDLSELRSVFDRRVKGQPEAVDCLVERVAMIKAGLTDPTRPAGVFLFAGPTGTGKTEIVKALTQFLFGSEQRMIRLDMSELQGEEAMTRLVGSPHMREGEAQSLAEQIRKQPFSVILLDEFEKAHPQIWDLFLQVFDDGRLTDRRSKLADFRHAIIVLTSNLGARLPAGAGLGFVDGTDTFRPSVVMKTIESSFRKEFINRLDRIVVFRPLSRETMREILAKELELAYGRRGLRNRGWAIEWEDAAFEFLLDRGFTHDLGARPLRRAIERYLLSPLARTIVDHRYPEGDQFLFVQLRDDELVVKFVDPDAPADDEVDDARTSPEDNDGRSLARIVLSPEGSRRELERLGIELETLEQRVTTEEWCSDKSSDVERMGATDFWNDPRRFETLGRLEYKDRIEAGVRRSRSLLDRLVRSGVNQRERHPREPVQRLAQQLFLLAHACEDVRLARPVDAFLRIDTGMPAGEAQGRRIEFARRLDEMYRAWCGRRGMQYMRLGDEEREARSGRYRATIAVSGYAAHTLLADEAGLHVHEIAARPHGHDTIKHQVRVLVAPQPAVPPQADRGGGAEAELRRQAEEALSDVGTGELAVIRHYREEPTPLVRDVSRGWRSGLLGRVFAGDFDLIANAALDESRSNPS